MQEKRSHRGARARKLDCKEEEVSDATGESKVEVPSEEKVGQISEMARGSFKRASLILHVVLNGHGLACS